MAPSGFLARAEFGTVADVAGREFSIGIAMVTLAETTTLRDVLTTTNVITFNTSPSPDFDGDGTVGFNDFLLLAGQFGKQRGDTGFDARFDLDGDGAIGFSDFLIFAQNFGKEVSSPGGLDNASLLPLDGRGNFDERRAGGHGRYREPYGFRGR